MPNKLDKKILFFDIETAPLKIWSWGVWQTDAVAVDSDWYMLSFSAKWLDGGFTTKGLPDYASYKTDKTNDRELISELHQLMSEADIIIGHNGDNFDIKKTNERIIYHGLTPPEPYKTIDTLKIAKKYFKFTKNNLNYICERLGIGSKHETGGKDLWLKCIDGDMGSWKKMLSYNKQDVVLLEALYYKLRSWIHNHPVMTTLNNQCIRCGSSSVQARGRADKKNWHRYRCNDCGSWYQKKNTQELLNRITIHL